MPTVATSARALFDSSPFFHFARFTAALKLEAYVGGRLSRTEDVERELAHNANKSEYAELKILARLPSFRNEKPLELPLELKQEAARLVKLSHNPGDDPRKNCGEASTVLMAQHLIGRGEAGVLTVMDDKWGTRLAAARKVPLLRTCDVAAEMMSAGRLGPDEAYRICKRASGLSKADFGRAIAEAAERARTGRR
jgi:hypothetical protein